jgi:hypothetical protein
VVFPHLKGQASERWVCQELRDAYNNLENLKKTPVKKTPETPETPVPVPEASTTD